MKVETVVRDVTVDLVENSVKEEIVEMFVKVVKLDDL